MAEIITKSVEVRICAKVEALWAEAPKEISYFNCLRVASNFFSQRKLEYNETVELFYMFKDGWVLQSTKKHY